MQLILLKFPVAHAPRTAGQSNYNFYGLIRYNFDLVTGFSLVPLQILTLLWHVSFNIKYLVFYLCATKHFFIGF